MNKMHVRFMLISVISIHSALILGMEQRTTEQEQTEAKIDEQKQEPATPAHNSLLNAMTPLLNPQSLLRGVQENAKKLQETVMGEAEKHVAVAGTQYFGTGALCATGATLIAQGNYIPGATVLAGTAAATQPLLTQQTVQKVTQKTMNAIHTVAEHANRESCNRGIHRCQSSCHKIMSWLTLGLYKDPHSKKRQ